MKRIQKIIIGSILSLSLLLVGGGQVVRAQGKTALRVGYLPILSQLPLVVSYETDRLNFEKIELELIRYNSFTALEAAMRVGALDAASITVPIALSMAADGHKINIIGTCQMGGSVLVARTKGDLKTVRGNVIGVPGLDSSENLTLSQVLGAIDLRYGLEYKTIGISFNTVIDDLRSNKLDALYLPEPFGTIAEKEKLAVAVQGQEGQLNGTLTTVIVVRSEILKKHKAGIKEWLESLVKSGRFIEEDIKQSGAKQTAIIQTKYFQYPQTIVADALVRHRGGMKFDHFVPDEENIKTYFNLATKLKILTKSVDFNSLIALNLIREVSK